jgi:allophanate hydrolase
LRIVDLQVSSLSALYQQAPEACVADLIDLRRRAAELSRDDVGHQGIWITLVPEEELNRQLASLEVRRKRGDPLPLSGVPFAVKDNIDVAGLPTTAACPAFSYVPAESAPVVQRILDAGAVLMGKTNLDQFASGLCGDRTPYGIARNAFAEDRIAGGSSSGSAAAVARGLVSFALGTDTAGSGRVPAACNNIVGLKPTLGRLSTRGVVPACRSLDCVSIMALSAADAWRVLNVMNGAPVPSAASGPKVFAVPVEEDLLFYGDEGQAQAFRQAMADLENLGWQRQEIDFRPFAEVGNLLYDGPWLAERLAGIEEFVAQHADKLHPVTRGILAGGVHYRAVDVFRGTARLAELRTVCLRVFETAAFLIVPGVPTIPTLDQAVGDSVGWSRRFGYYTNFANLLGLAAVTVPTGFTPTGLPVGITVLGPGGSEEALCRFADAWQRQRDLELGKTGTRLRAPASWSPALAKETAKDTVRVSVAGAHLRGEPLHPALLQFGAQFVRAARTAHGYRFMAFMDLKPPRPGLLRDAAAAGGIAVELYDLPMEGFGRLVASVAPPLSIGTVELDDGSKVKGFLCESAAAAQARDITADGGWIAFRNARKEPV